MQLFNIYLRFIGIFLFLKASRPVKKVSNLDTIEFIFNFNFI